MSKAIKKATARQETRVKSLPSSKKAMKAQQKLLQQRIDLLARFRARLETPADEEKQESSAEIIFTLSSPEVPEIDPRIRQVFDKLMYEDEETP